jgi:CBS domain containing-hemolysin-like protein
LAEPFEASEEAMIQGALSLSSLTAESAQKLLPCAKCFTLSADAKMDRPTMQAVLDSSASRVPVHAPGEHGLWLGYLLVKDHLLLDPDDEVLV